MFELSPRLGSFEHQNARLTTLGDNFEHVSTVSLPPE